jgi:hypothetical protein
MQNAAAGTRIYRIGSAGRTSNGKLFFGRAEWQEAETERQRLVYELSMTYHEDMK